MMAAYLLDACALIALLSDEPGGEKVDEIYSAVRRGDCSLLMHKLNLLEVYYGFWRDSGKPAADKMLMNVSASPILLVSTIADEVFGEAGRLKATYRRLSLADAIVLAEAHVRGAAVVTCDHHEFDPIAAREPIAFEWIR